MLDFIAPFFIGLVGSVHCLGMCGPVVMAYSLNARPGEATGRVGRRLWIGGLRHHLAFHTGRILTYGLLGATAALFAQGAGVLSALAGLRGGFTLLGGAVLIFIGFALLKAFRPPAIPLFSPESFWGRRFGALLAAPGLPAKGLLGAAMGFLPCMLSWAMVVKAATSPNPAAGFATCALFGLGTVPALLFTGFSASLLSWKARLYGERVAACSVLLMGAILLYKGARYFA